MIGVFALRDTYVSDRGELSGVSAHEGQVIQTATLEDRYSLGALAACGGTTMPRKVAASFPARAMALKLLCRER